jgi:type II secretory pathway pseudopilin PulG
MVLAIFILLLILLLAVPSLTGVLADRRLRRSLDSFNKLVIQAREHSITDHRAYLIVVGDKSVEVRPEVVTKEDDPAPVAELPLKREEAVTLSLPDALVKNPPPEWIFWPSGVCEPATIEFAGHDGSWAVNYSPLTAQPEVLKYAPR